MCKLHSVFSRFYHLLVLLHKSLKQSALAGSTALMAWTNCTCCTCSDSVELVVAVSPDSFSGFLDKVSAVYRDLPGALNRILKLHMVESKA